MQHSTISKSPIPKGQAISLADLRPGIRQLIEQQYPHVQDTEYISLSELNAYRRKYMTVLLQAEAGDISKID